MIADSVFYRFESFLYPAKVSRIEIESGQSDWVYIRRRHHQLASQRKEQVLLYVYNDDISRWEYIGKTYPDGRFYYDNGSGPYELTADGKAYHMMKGGKK